MKLLQIRRALKKYSIRHNNFSIRPTKAGLAYDYETKNFLVRNGTAFKCFKMSFEVIFVNFSITKLVARVRGRE